MLDPNLTNILRRRIIASLVDLALLGATTAAIWRSLLIQFPFERDSITNEPIYDPVQRAKRNEIAQGLNTEFLFRDSSYALDQSGIILVSLFFLVMSLLLFVLLPASVGWSPGHRLFGLRVSDDQGANPTLVQHLTRSVVGLVDLLPLVVPGLLGWMLAKGDDFHRRLGDRVAKTSVIDSRAELNFINPDAYARRSELRRNTRDHQPDMDQMIEVEARLTGRTTTPASAPGTDAVAPSAAAESAVPAESLTFPTAPDPQPAPATPQPLDPEPTTTPSEHHRQAPAQQVPGTPPSQTQVPDSVEPTPASRPASSPDAASEPTVAERYRATTAAALAAEQATSEARTESVDPASLRHAASAPTSAPEPTHRRRVPRSTEADYDRPTPEPAPVWRPGDATPERPATPAVATAGSADDDADRDRAARAGQQPTQTVWNDQWQAWLYWDAAGRRWLRHDRVTDQWIALGE